MDLALLLTIIGVIVTVVAWLISPAPVKRWLRRVVMGDDPPRSDPAIEVFDGRVEVIDEGALDHPADPNRVRQFYEGAPLDWDVIAAHADIERDQYEALIGQLAPPYNSLRVICILGEPGSGKSTLAWRLASDLHHRRGTLVLRVKDNEDPEIWYQMTEFARRVRIPFCVLIDDLFRSSEVVRALRDLNPWLPLTILATSQSNEYHPGRIKAEVLPVHLQRPSQYEKERIRSRVEAVSGKLSPERSTRLSSANEFWVLMMELTAGKRLNDIVQDSLTNLLQLHEPIYRAYEYLCFSYSCGIAVPASVLERLDGKGRVQDLPSKEGAQGLIFEVEGRPGLVRPGHPKRAEIARDVFERSRSAASVLEKLVKGVDISNASERRFIAHLLRGLAHVRPNVVNDVTPRVESELGLCSRSADRISELAIWRSLYLALGRIDAAEESVTAALALEPVTQNDCTWALELLRASGREREALSVFARWIRHHPDLGGVRMAYLGLVKKYGTDSDQMEALKQTSTWLDVHAEDTDVRMAYLGLVERKGSPQQISTVLNSTNAWLAAHKDENYIRTSFLGLVESKGTPEQLADVLKETSSWLAKHDEDTTVRTAYLGLVERKGTLLQREQLLREMPTWLRTHPRATDVWVRFICQLCDSEQVDDALTLAQEAISTNVKDANLALLYWNLMKDRLDEPGVRELSSSLINSFPDDANIGISWACWLQKNNHLSEAEANFRSMIAMYPESFSHPYHYGKLLLELSRFDEAAVQFKRVLSIHRGHQMAHVGLAETFWALAHRAFEKGDRMKADRFWASAEREFKTAIYWADTNFVPEEFPYNRIGWFFVEIGRFNEALIAFAHAADEAPDSFDSYWGRARALAGLERWEEALLSLRIVEMKAPRSLESSTWDSIHHLKSQSEAAVARRKGSAMGKASLGLT